MKVRNSLLALKSKPGAQVVKRGKRVYVLNRKEPHLKARQG
jgi:large subunit ribosomal protein L36